MRTFERATVDAMAVSDTEHALSLVGSSVQISERSNAHTPSAAPNYVFTTTHNRDQRARRASGSDWH